jgi:hypothetical protein
MRKNSARAAWFAFGLVAVFVLLALVLSRSRQFTSLLGQGTTAQSSGYVHTETWGCTPITITSPFEGRAGHRGSSLLDKPGGQLIEGLPDGSPVMVDAGLWCPDDKAWWHVYRQQSERNGWITSEKFLGFEQVQWIGETKAFMQWQPFENGMMLWIEPANRVFAMFRNGHYVTSCPEGEPNLPAHFVGALVGSNFVGLYQCPFVRAMLGRATDFYGDFWGTWEHRPSPQTDSSLWEDYVTLFNGNIAYLRNWAMPINLGVQSWSFTNAEIPPSKCPVEFVFGEQVAASELSSLADEGIATCPYLPASTVQAHYQPFERGFIIATDTLTFVMQTSFMEDTNIAFGGIYPTTWQPGDAIQYPAAKPPAGLLRPEGRIGKVWAETTNWGTGPLYGRTPHERTPGFYYGIGWATAPEQQYTLTYQYTLGAPVGLTSKLYLTLPDGSLVVTALDGSPTTLQPEARIEQLLGFNVVAEGTR